jgi:hypothetical protein
MRTRAVAAVCGLVALAAPALSSSAIAERGDSVPAADYPLYSRVIASKFLSSQTELVLIGHETVTSLGPIEPGKPLSRRLFDEQAFFEGKLPEPLVIDFVLKNQKPVRLERRFAFGVSYRLVAPDSGDSPEVSLPAIPVSRSARRTQHSALPIQAPRRVGILMFSRVAYWPHGNEALLYVGDHRMDLTGAGFLVRLRRTAADWEIAETDVIWRIGPEEGEAPEVPTR